MKAHLTNFGSALNWYKAYLSEAEVNSSIHHSDQNMEQHFYKQLKIENFRGIKSLEIDDLARVNLFVGRNNCGKTSVLEAIFFADRDVKS
jgi:recombinational DNA repair ATPase RecF